MVSTVVSLHIGLAAPYSLGYGPWLGNGVLSALPYARPVSPCPVALKLGSQWMFKMLWPH
jgi:hypothetical protein